MKDFLKDIRKHLSTAWGDYQSLFDAVARAENPLLQQVLEYIFSKRGKELRPLVLLLAAKMCSYHLTEKTTNCAVALELLHTASLIHDDVVDASSMRHNQSAVQEKWTNKVAILVGDFVLSKVMNLVINVRNKNILQAYSAAFEQLSSGELLQLHFADKKWLPEDVYFQIIEQKTAFLFSQACYVGALSVDGTSTEAAALREFGNYLGLCFQLKDDLLDLSDNEQIGKPTMEDLQDGKITLALAKTHERATAQEKQDIEALTEQYSIAQDKYDIEQKIKSYIYRYDGIGYVQQYMQKLQEKGLACLDIFQESAEKEYMCQLLNYAIYREK